MTLLYSQADDMIYSAEYVDEDGYLRDCTIRTRWLMAFDELPKDMWLIDTGDTIVKMEHREVRETYEVL